MPVEVDDMKPRAEDNKPKAELSTPLMETVIIVFYTLYCKNTLPVKGF